MRTPLFPPVLTPARAPAPRAASRVISLVAVAALAACSSPADEALPDLPDLGAVAVTDLAAAPDLSSPPDLVSVRCELPPELKLIPMVSTGTATVGTLPTDPEVRTAEVDATAGGSMVASKNPFIYLDLINGKKVDLTDPQAQESRDWDLALKRWQIKVNSGDSGPGGVTVAYVDNVNLAEVAAAPTGRYEADHYFDEKCQVQLDPINGLKTQLAEWYPYDASPRIEPRKRVYVLKRRDGKGHIKLQIITYYKGATSAFFTLHWGFLP